MKMKPFPAIGIAAMLWFLMFSPWTSSPSLFWIEMSASAAVLSAIAVKGGSLRIRREGSLALQTAAGIAIAFALWGIFWCGDRISALIFDFARGQVDSVYGMKEGASPWLIAALLLLLIGPAEELFWRGYVQRILSSRVGPTASMFITVIVYALVHIWSFNFMLVMAAAVAGGVWGLIYRLKPSLLPALVISHALWDALVFVILPI